MVLARCLGALLVTLALTACLYDSDNRCGTGQEQSRDGYCVCKAGLVPSSDRTICIACGPNQEVRSGKCECAEGFTAPTPGAACVAQPTGLGATCDPAMPACPAARYGHCQTAASGQGGYCTSSGCATSMDCPMGYACRTGSTGRYCARAPLGQGKPCSTQQECADGEAKLCDPMYLHQCLVEGCRPGDPESCHDGWLCCDLTALGLAKQVCLPLPECPKPP